MKAGARETWRSIPLTRGSVSASGATFVLIFIFQFLAGPLRPAGSASGSPVLVSAR